MTASPTDDAADETLEDAVPAVSLKVEVPDEAEPITRSLMSETALRVLSTRRPTIRLGLTFSFKASTS